MTDRLLANGQRVEGPRRRTSHSTLHQGVFPASALSKRLSAFIAAQTSSGSFGSASAALRVAVASLRMTVLASLGLQKKPKADSLRFEGLDHHVPAHLTAVHELDASADLGEKGIVFAAANVQSGLYTSAALPHDDGPAGNDLPAERLKAQPLRIGIAAVA